MIKIIRYLQVIAAMMAVGGVLGFFVWGGIGLIKLVPVVGYCYSAILIGCVLFLASTLFEKPKSDNK